VLMFEKKKKTRIHLFGGREKGRWSSGTSCVALLLLRSLSLHSITGGSTIELKLATPSYYVCSTCMSYRS
jgi:hypothetical protein